MEFDLAKTKEILERTPRVLTELLAGISDDWTEGNEGGQSWSPREVIGHLIHGEKTDWIPRMEIILSEAADKRFVPFDRFAQLREADKKSLMMLLEEFAALRQASLDTLSTRKLSTSDLARTGIHPAFGEVTLSQLLAAWAVHDLGHIVQVARVMAKQYRAPAGPWHQYLSVLGPDISGTGTRG
ncbi:MAG TPA: DinB family protein [Puia sp.]|nr:DinB family protein [Puia sp.]